MATAPPAYDSEHKQQNSETAKSFDATISATLEISSYDLAVLKRHLIAQKWVPAEDAVEDAVFRFRRTYRPNRAYGPGYDYDNIFRDNKRLTRLFEVWASEEIEESEADRSFDPNEVNEHEIERETAKHDAVRVLIAHLAARKSCVKPTGTTSASLDIADGQAMELLKTNARLRAIFANNMKKATAKETETLNQRARKAAREMAAQAEDKIVQDLAQVSIAESAANSNEKKEGVLQRSIWSAARESAEDVSQETSMAEDVDMSEGQPAASDSDATMEPRRPMIVAQDEKMSAQARLDRFQASIAEKTKADKIQEAAIQ